MSERHRSASKYASQARHYLANATRLAREPRGIEKAGEMVWGAMILALKAVGAARGRKITKYRAALQFAREVAPQDMVTVMAAKGLHGQFYESEVDAAALEDVKSQVEVLVDRLLTENGL